MELLGEQIKGREAEIFRPLLLRLQAKKSGKVISPYVPLWELMPLDRQCQLALLWKEAGFFKEAGQLASWLSELKSFPCLWCSEKEFDEKKIQNELAKLEDIEKIPGWKPECDLTLLQMGDCSAALTLDGKGTSLGMIRSGIEVRAFGPQAGNLSFGIEGKGMAQWTRTSGYKDVWLEMKPEIKKGVIELHFRFAGVSLEKPCSLAFYIKAESCEIGGEILRPKSLKRFLGEAQTVQFEKKYLIQSAQPHKVEVIPLAGENCFWGAEFLLNYSISPFSPQLNLQIPF